MKMKMEFVKKKKEKECSLRQIFSQQENAQEVIKLRRVQILLKWYGTVES